MADRLTKQIFETAEQLRAAIAAIVVKRSIKASQSQYDMKVCVGAVGATRRLARQKVIAKRKLDAAASQDS